MDMHLCIYMYMYMNNWGFFCITSKSSFQYQYHVFKPSYKTMKYVSQFLEL